MKPKVYVETSVVSYLVGRRGGDVIQLSHQTITTAWWTVRGRYSLYVSDLVLQEAAAGDAGAATRRLAVIERLPILHVSEEAIDLASEIMQATRLPKKANADALHIALAAAHGMDYLVSWNCRHIANVLLRGKIEGACRSVGLEPPAICTPEEILGDQKK
jgi:predicted nucleic acid-binding protein